MEKEQLLRNPEVYPSDEVIAAALGDSYKAYTAFTQKLPDSGIAPEWRYYNDGKSWLCKGVYKKKTVFWLSVWDGFFKVSLFFTEKTRVGIAELPVNEDIKTQIANEPARGKLIPLLLDVYSQPQLDNAITLMSYKQSLK